MWWLQVLQMYQHKSQNEATDVQTIMLIAKPLGLYTYSYVNATVSMKEK